MRDAVRLDPTNAQAWLDLGDVAGRTAGSLTDSADAFKKYRHLAEERQDRREIMVADIRIGNVLGAQGKLDEALTRYRDALAVAERLAASDPTNTEWQRDVSVSFNKIGDMLRAQGKLDEALTRYRESLAVRQRLAASDPTNTVWQRDVSVSFDRIGDVLRAQGKLDEALTRYRDGLAVAERLAASDATNALWQMDLAMSYASVATLDTVDGNPLRRKALTIMNSLQAEGLLAPKYLGFLQSLRGGAAAGGA